MKPDIYKIDTIGKGFLAVMAKPVAGEWLEDEFLGICNANIHQIVSLLEFDEAYTVGLQNEEELTIRYGMSFISYPIRDRGLPKTISSFSSFTQNIYQELLNGKNTVIHCRAGIGRTGLVAAGVLLHHGMLPDKAFELLSIKRGVNVPDTDEQRNWLMSNYREITHRSDDTENKLK